MANLNNWITVSVGFLNLISISEVYDTKVCAQYYLNEQRRVIMQVHGSHIPGLTKIHGKTSADSKKGKLSPSASQEKKSAVWKKWTRLVLIRRPCVHKLFCTFQGAENPLTG